MRIWRSTRLATIAAFSNCGIISIGLVCWLPLRFVFYRIFQNVLSSSRFGSKEKSQEVATVMAQNWRMCSARRLICKVNTAPECPRWVHVLRASDCHILDGQICLQLPEKLTRFMMFPRKFVIETAGLAGLWKNPISRFALIWRDLLQHISTWFAAPCIHYQNVTNRRSYSTFALKHSEQIVVEKAKGVRVTSLLPCFQVEVRSTSRSGRTTWVSHSVYRSKSTCVLQYFRSWVRHLGQKALQSIMPEKFHECMFVLFVCFPCRWLSGFRFTQWNHWATERALRQERKAKCDKACRQHYFCVFIAMHSWDLVTIQERHHSCRIIVVWGDQRAVLTLLLSFGRTSGSIRILQLSIAVHSCPFVIIICYHYHPESSSCHSCLEWLKSKRAHCGSKDLAKFGMKELEDIWD